MLYYLLPLMTFFVSASIALAEDAGSGPSNLGNLQLKHRWVFTMTNLAREDACRRRST